MAVCAVNCTVDSCSCCSHSTSQIFVENSENSDLYLTNLHLTPPLGSPCRNIAITFGTEKLEWRGYQTLKKF